jgi:HK97 gp10 family phage protein
MTNVILGLPEAMAKIAAIPLVAETVGETSLEAGKAEVAMLARALAPKRTGALAASIIPVPEGVAAVQEYAGFVEFGTVNMSAEPYLDPAMERAGPIVGKQVTEAVKTALYAL